MSFSASKLSAWRIPREYREQTGGHRAQQHGVQNEDSVEGILQRAGAYYIWQYPFKDAKSLGRGINKVDFLIYAGWHPEDKIPVLEINPKTGFPTACVLETRSQDAPGTTKDKMFLEIYHTATLMRNYGIPKGRLVLAGQKFTEEFIEVCNREWIPELRSCERLNIEVLRLEELFRRTKQEEPL